jgi:hypothetical protein
VFEEKIDSWRLDLMLKLDAAGESFLEISPRRKWSAENLTHVT